jgi:hypothetical protein
MCFSSSVYIGFTHMYIYRIIFCMVLSTWLHTKLLCEGFDNVFAFHNLQIPSFKFSQIVFAPLENLFWCLLNVNLCPQQLCKATSFTYDLGLIYNFGATWKIVYTIMYQNFSLVDFIKWKILLLPWNHFKLELENKMIYKSFSKTPKSLRFW